MSNLAQILLGLLSLISFLFFYWRTLKEDFSEDTIFKSGFIMAFGFLIGSLVFINIIPRIFPASRVFSYTGLWFWGALIGVFVSFLLSCRRYKLPFYETLDAVSLGFFVASIFVTRELLYPLTTIAAFYFFKRRYKSFSFYKSGKIGFAGLASLGVFFLLRSALAVTGSPVLVFTGIGKVETVLGSAISFLCFFTVYNLGES